VGRGVVQYEHFVDRRRSSDANVRIFWLKTSDFSKLKVCPYGQGGGAGVEER